MQDINMTKVVSEILSSANDQAKRAMQYHDLLVALDNAGVKMPVATTYAIKYGYVIPIDKSDLPKVRSVVGRLRVTGKDASWDFDKTNELDVTVEPVDKEYVATFSYRTKYRKGGKCEIVETINQASVSKRLVCNI